MQPLLVSTSSINLATETVCMLLKVSERCCFPPLIKHCLLFSFLFRLMILLPPSKPTAIEIFVVFFSYLKTLLPFPLHSHVACCWLLPPFNLQNAELLIYAELAAFLFLFVLFLLLVIGISSFAGPHELCYREEGRVRL